MCFGLVFLFDPSKDFGYFVYLTKCTHPLPAMKLWDEHRCIGDVTAASDLFVAVGVGRSILLYGGSSAFELDLGMRTIRISSKVV